MSLFIDYAPVAHCKRPQETYGEICVQCNDCGRFNEKPTMEEANNE